MAQTYSHFHFFEMGLCLNLEMWQNGSVAVMVPLCKLVSISSPQGDGLEFKKLFKKIKESLSDIVCRPPVS